MITLREKIEFPIFVCKLEPHVKYYVFAKKESQEFYRLLENLVLLQREIKKIATLLLIRSDWFNLS